MSEENTKTIPTEIPETPKDEALETEISKPKKRKTGKTKTFFLFLRLLPVFHAFHTPYYH